MREFGAGRVRRDVRSPVSRSLALHLTRVRGQADHDGTLLGPDDDDAGAGRAAGGLCDGREQRREAREGLPSTSQKEPAAEQHRKNRPIPRPSPPLHANAAQIWVIGQIWVTLGG